MHINELFWMHKFHFQAKFYNAIKFTERKLAIYSTFDMLWVSKFSHKSLCWGKLYIGNTHKTQYKENNERIMICYLIIRIQVFSIVYHPTNLSILLWISWEKPFNFLFLIVFLPHFMSITFKKIKRSCTCTL